MVVDKNGTRTHIPVGSVAYLMLVLCQRDNYGFSKAGSGQPLGARMQA